MKTNRPIVMLAVRTGTLLFGLLFGLVMLVPIGCGEKETVQPEKIGARVVESSQYGDLGWKVVTVKNTGDEIALNVRVCISCATWPQDLVFVTDPDDLKPGAIGKVRVNADRAVDVVWIDWD